jgi:hypothetical protein
MFVIGMGERKTPRPFIVSCDKFIYIENLGNEDEETAPQKQENKEEAKPAQPKEKISNALIKLLRHTIDDLADDNDLSNLSGEQVQDSFRESEMVNDYGVKARPIEDIIEHRYDRQLLTVCTTNLTAGEIRDKYGERIYSRICETFSMVPVNGMDFRQTSA